MTPDLPPASARAGAESKGSFLYLAVVCLVAALGGLLFGFDTAVISGTIGFLTEQFGLSAAMKGWTASCALVGCIFGAMVAGTLSDRFGRKKILLLAAVLFTASALLAGIPEPLGAAVRWLLATVVNLLAVEPPVMPHPELTGVIVARLIGGLGIGMASMLSPMYIAEISPPKSRGRLVSLQQFAIISGMLLAYFSNAVVLSIGMPDDLKWRWMFGLGTFPAALFFLLLLAVPESPRWLTKQGRADRARRILARVAGDAAADAEMREIQDAIAHESGSLRQLLGPGLRVALLVGVALAILQQVTGINAILYYAPEIFKQAGAGATSAFNDTVWIGAFNLAFTIVAIWLIDRIGRRPLLLGGALGMGLSLVLVGVAFQAKWVGAWLLLPILAYVSSFAASMGPVVWVVMSEIFPTRIRGRAMSIATLLLWFACYGVSQTFPILVERFGSAAAFWAYAVMCAVTIVFVLALVPETKGRTLEQIEKHWMGRS